MRHVLDPTPEPTEIGAAIRDCLNHSRFYLDYPDVVGIIDDWFDHAYETYDQTLMELAGVKTLGSLYRGAKGINVDDRDGTINFTAFPERRGRHFFNPGPKPSFMLHLPLDADNEALGDAFYEALEHCGT